MHDAPTIRRVGVMSFSLEQRKAAVRLYLETVWQQAGDAQESERSAQDLMRCPRQVRKIIRTSLPDLHFTLLELMAEGETVVARWSIQGTDSGGYEGHLPTGRPVSLTGITLVRVDGPDVVEEYSETNLASMQRQLGFVALPVPRITIRQPGPKRPY